MIAVPDTAQKGVYDAEIGPHLRDGQLLMFAHGFNIHFGRIDPPGNVDVGMVAPKGPGHLVRSVYQAGGGVPALFAVEQDASGTGRARVLAYARALGNTRAGVLETTFKEETETDLFGDQAVLCGGAVTVPVYPTLSAAQARYILSDSGARIAVVSTMEQLEKVQAVRHQLTAIAAVILMISLIGGRIVPSFTNNWLNRNNPGRLPVPFSQFDMVALVISAFALVSWIITPMHWLSGALLIVAGCLQAVRLARWAGRWSPRPTRPAYGSRCSTRATCTAGSGSRPTPRRSGSPTARPHGGPSAPRPSPRHPARRRST